MTTQNYHVKLRHDNGTVTLAIYADSPESAAEWICAIEGAPARSVVSVKAAPPACDCSENDGPCETHSQILASYGDASHSAHELMSIFIHECLAIDPKCLAPQGVTWLADADAALERGRDARSGVAWIAEEDEEALDGLRQLCDQVESHLADVWITWDGGFTIARITGGPLAEDAS